MWFRIEDGGCLDGVADQHKNLDGVADQHNTLGKGEGEGQVPFGGDGDRCV